jgi:hypothetical protein
MEELQRDEEDSGPKLLQENVPSELPYGLHWNYGGSISNTHPKKSPILQHK